MTSKQALHQLHYLLETTLYLGMDGPKFPEHLKGVQEALAIVKSELKKCEDQFDNE